MMTSSRDFMQCLVVLLLGLPGAALAQDRTFTFLVTSDSHYEALEKVERNDRNRLTIERMNELPGTEWPERLGGGKIGQPRGVLVLGDLIDDGDKAGETEIEWRAFVEQFGLDGADGLLKYPVFEGCGNHDGPPEGFLKKQGRSVQTEIKKRNAQRLEKKLISRVSENGLHYSWDWEGVHFIQANLYPADKQNAKVRYSLPWHDPQLALSFVKKDLAETVGDSGRPVVIAAHCGFDTDWWVLEDWTAFYEAIEPYNIVAFFHGHSGTGVRKWKPAGAEKPLDVVNTGQTEKGFFVVEVSKSRMRLGFHVKQKAEVLKNPEWTWKFLFETAIERPVAESALGKLETVKLAVGKKGFVLHPSGKRYVPWGHNYASVDILERLAKDPARVEREFAEMKAAGTTVARIHPELSRILSGPTEVDAKGVDGIKQLLLIAEKTGIHLKITGLANYRIKDREAWYDRLPEPDRWQAQAFFWETVARACAESPAVFAYDLVNEPGAVGKPEDGWYFGRMGEVEFCQRLSLNPGERKGEEIFRAWTKLMVAAIRKHDKNHLITMGMLPFPGAYQAVAEELNFVSPHLYPKSGKVAEEVALLKKFDWGKPIVIGETFPLSCSKDDEREFLLKSREFAHGWIGHWPDESPVELAELKKTGKATIANAIWLSWVELFKELGPQMIDDK